MQHIFGDHIGRTVEAYIDDIVMKTRKADDLFNDLHIAFGCLRANGVKLNPEKCVFDVPRGMLLGYIVSQRGIEANLEKVAALERMGPIRDLKGVQKVLGCLAALSRFIVGRRGTHQHLEHPAATLLLPLARISKFFVVNYMPNTPVGNLDVKINKSIK
jgi:hypothetical protein